MSGNKEQGHFCLRDGGHIESLTVHCFGSFHKIRPCLYITEQQLGCDEMDPIRAIRLLARFVNLLLPAFRLILFYGRLFDEMSSHLFQISLRKGTTSIRRQQWPLGHTSERRREQHVQRSCLARIRLQTESCGFFVSGVEPASFSRGRPIKWREREQTLPFFMYIYLFFFFFSSSLLVLSTVVALVDEYNN